MSVLINAFMGNLKYTQPQAQSMQHNMSNHFKDVFTQTVTTKESNQLKNEESKSKVEGKDRPKEKVKQSSEDNSVQKQSNSDKTKDVERSKEETSTKEETKTDKSSSETKKVVESEQVTTSVKDKKKVTDSLETELSMGQIQEVSPVVSSIMQQLGVSLEEVVTVLDEMGISSYELSDEKTFSEFLTNLFSTDIENLLTGAKEIKDVNKLFNTIVEIVNQEVDLESKGAVEKEIFTQFLAQSILPNKVDESNRDIKDALNAQSIPLTVLTAENGSQTMQITTNSSLEEAEGSMQTVALESFVEGAETNNQPGFSFQSRSYQTFTDLASAKTQQFSSGEKIDFAQQLIEKMHLKTLQQGKELSIELAPKELGRLALKLTEEQGVISANIKVDSEKTKELLLQNIESLKQNLQEQGLQIGSFEVDVRDNSSRFEMEKQKQKSSKRIEELINKHLNEELLEEVEEEGAKPPTETIVDYMA